MKYNKFAVQNNPRPNIVFKWIDLRLSSWWFIVLQKIKLVWHWNAFISKSVHKWCLLYSIQSTKKHCDAARTFNRKMNLWIIFQISNYNGSTLSVWVSCLLAVNLPDILKKACFKAANIIFTVTELKLNHVIMITWGNKVTSINTNDVFQRDSAMKLKKTVLLWNKAQIIQS